MITKLSHRSRGFTLVELLISLVAGLLVAMAVIALGRDATNTFQDEARSSTAQMSVRLSKERIRADLERVGFMTTANIGLDPMITRPNGDLINTGAPAAPTNLIEPGIKGLVAARLDVGGSRSNGENIGTDQGGFGFSANNSLNPDRIEISGNFTTADEYAARVEQPAGACGAARIHLNPQDPAVLRLVLNPDSTAKTAADATTAIQAMVTPVAGQPFGIRISDVLGNHFQYASVCISGAAASAGETVAFPNGDIFIDTANPVLDQSVPNGIVTSGVAGSDAIVSPFQTVRWDLRRVANAILDGPTTATNQARFELVRSWVPTSFAAFDTTLSTNCPQCSETVSEFAVDLKFGFSVADQAAPNVITTFDIDDAAKNPLWAPSAGFVPNAKGPQRIRGVRFRLGARAAQPDRISTLAAPPNYLFRYCTDSIAIATCKNFARVRTTVEDVYLSNLARLNY